MHYALYPGKCPRFLTYRNIILFAVYVQTLKYLEFRTIPRIFETVRGIKLMAYEQNFHYNAK